MKITLGLERIFLLLVLTVAMAFPGVVQGQSDNFDDGDDTANPTWTHYDPIGLSLGGSFGSWTFPGSNTYRLQAFSSPDPGLVGPGRIASTLTNEYSDFYTTVDVLDWDDTLDQAFGILARLENVGPGTTTGYVFTYQELDHRVSISSITNEVAADLPGAFASITLDKTNDYRFVFMGQGTNFEGRVYQLPDTSNPIVVVQGADDTYTNGIGGLLVYDNSSGGTNTADATYDNYFAVVSEPPPVITSTHNITNNAVAPNTIGVRFDQLITLPSATNQLNYLVNAGTVGVTDVRLRPDGRSVELVTTAPVSDFFSVCATNVQGLSGHSALTIGGGYVSEYSGVTIGTLGDPSTNGEVFTSFWDTFNVNTGGSSMGDVGALDDHGHFIQQLMTGDFDVRVRVLQLEMADPSSEAGLMARESLNADSASVQTFLTSTGGLNQILATVRPATAANAIDFLSSPPVLADTNDWLRMTRSNDIFTAYYATNGSDWIISGVTTQSFATNLYVGMAASAHSFASNINVTFTDFYARGRRPGDEILPTLTATRVGNRIQLKWPQTPRSYALEVRTNLIGSDQWALLAIPVGFDFSNRMFQTSLPFSLFGSRLFIRNTRVDKLIPDIPAIMLGVPVAGITLAPDGGGLTSYGSGGQLGIYYVKPSSLVTGTNYIWFTNATTASYIDTKDSSSSTGKTDLDTVLQVRNVTTSTTSGPLSYNDNDPDTKGEIKSKLKPLPGTLAALSKFTFVGGVKTNSSFATVIKIHFSP